MGIATISSNRTMSESQQRQVLISFVTALINKQNEETEITKLLSEFAQRWHATERHPGVFLECQNESCSKAKNLLTKEPKLETTFIIQDLEKMQGYRLHYGSKVTGTVSIWIEKPEIISLVG